VLLLVLLLGFPSSAGQEWSTSRSTSTSRAERTRLVVVLDRSGLRQSRVEDEDENEDEDDGEKPDAPGPDQEPDMGFGRFGLDFPTSGAIIAVAKNAPLATLTPRRCCA